MYDIYRENRCPQCCFKGGIFSTQIRSVRIVECLRDNEDAKDRFKRTSNNDDLKKWILQEGNFLHCLYSEDPNI